MIDHFLKPFLPHHHRFRHMTFDELSELYTSMMLRSLAMSMAGIFVPIFLYQSGYSLVWIFGFYTISFTVQAIVAFPIAKLVARYGPKHMILISYFIQAAMLVGLIRLIDTPYILVVAVLLGLANMSFFLPFHMNFSKVKHKRKSGSEVGWLYIMERSGAVLGPLVGGIIAFLFEPQYTFMFAIVLLLIAALPLFLTKEAVDTHQKLHFRSFSIKKAQRDIWAFSFFSTEVPISMIIWPLFLGVIVFQDNPYVQLGSILSISILASIILARVVGKVVDNRKGRLLLRMNATLNALIHLLRPFTSGYSMALAVNVANDAVTTGYRMPFLKGLYDAADDHPGYRIVYVAYVELASAIMRAGFFGLATLLAFVIASQQNLFTILFTIGAVISMGIMVEHFPALNPKRKWGLGK